MDGKRSLFVDRPGPGGVVRKHYFSKKLREHYQESYSAKILCEQPQPAGQVGLLLVIVVFDARCDLSERPAMQQEANGPKATECF